MNRVLLVIRPSLTSMALVVGPFKLVTVEEIKVLWPLAIRWCSVPSRVWCYVSGWA